MKDNWQEYSIKDICNVKGGKRLPAGKSFAEGWTPFPYLRVSDMVNATIDTSNLVFVSNEIEKHITNYKISKSDIYVTIAGTLGNFGTIPDELNNAQLTENAAKLTGIDYERHEKDFLKYYFNSNEVQHQIRREFGIGGGVPKLALHRIEKLKLLLPNKRIQCKIAQILTTCDAVIEKTEAAIAKYQAIKQGTMHDLFTRGIDLKTGKLRPKYGDAPQLYKKSVLGWIPKEWEENILYELTKLITDGSHFSPVPQESGLPIGNVKDMTPSGFNYESCTKILPDVFSLLAKQNCAPQKGDVLLSKDGTIGRVIHFNDDMKIVLLSSIAILRVNELLFSGYLAWVLQSEYFDKELYKLLSGSALKRITLKDIQKIRISFPKSKDEQELIEKKLNTIDNKIQSEQSTLSKYRQIKAGLMQDLLSGKVEVEVEEESQT